MRSFSTPALKNNTTGSHNTAVGTAALLGNKQGSSNTAVGECALCTNIFGTDNTAVGSGALELNPNGGSNTAVGFRALNANTTAIFNTAVGSNALAANITGASNTAVGADGTLGSNTSGAGNTAVGFVALAKNTNGGNNIALGFEAGANLAGGSNNIYVGNQGAATESNTMRLWHKQTSTFIAGIAGAHLTGSDVVVTSAGQLGISASSARYKHNIQTMGARSRGLFQLRPVIFRYKQDPQGVRQYGLIAEEVARVYPELLTRRSDGAVESVQYHELIPMVLNELQRQQRELGELRAQTERLQAALAGQTAALKARSVRLEETT